MFSCHNDCVSSARDDAIEPCGPRQALSMAAGWPRMIAHRCGIPDHPFRCFPGLGPGRIVRKGPMPTRDQIIEVYGPQLGELAWHALHMDATLAAVSEKHAASILKAVQRWSIKPRGRPIRILEIGAYAHFGAHRAAAALGGISVAHDVSPASLRVGLDGARAAGITGEVT